MAGTYLNYPFDAEIFTQMWNEEPDPVKTALLNSGVLAQDALIASQIQGDGNYYTIPFYNVLGGDPVNYDGQTDITSEETTADTQSGIVYGRAKGFTARDFVAELSGSNPMGHIASTIGKYWAKQRQQKLLQVLSAVFGITGGTAGSNQKLWADNHTADLGSTTATPYTIGKTDLNDLATQACGDNKSIFSMAIMHSNVAKTLENIQVLEYWKQTDANGLQRPVGLASANGYTVIIDDGVPAVKTGGSGENQDLVKYTTYLLGQGVIRTAQGRVAVSYTHLDVYKRQGLSEAAARRLLSRLPDSAKLEKLKAVISKIKDPEKRQMLLRIIASPAYAHRIERLELLWADVQTQTERLAGMEQAVGAAHYKSLAQEAYSRAIFDIQKGIGLSFPFTKIPNSRIHEILQNNWSGRLFSERIWGNAEDLNRKIKEELLVGFMTGRSYAKTASAISGQLQVSSWKARRLVRTESTYVANMAELESYKEIGVARYRFVATLDMRTSALCAAMDGKLFAVSQALPGVNLPPLHPWCRSTTVAEISDALMAKLTRHAKNPVTGKTEEFPAGMTYPQWKEEMKRRYGEGAWKTAKRKAAARGADKKQYELYRKTLGQKLIPETFDKFQETKYTGGEAWERLKRNYTLFDSIDKKESYSKEYKSKLKRTYRYFSAHGYEFTEHGLNRVVGQKKSKGKKQFTNQEILEILQRKPNYSQQDGKLIKFYNGLAVVQAKDTGEVISLVAKKKARKDWMT